MAAAEFDDADLHVETATIMFADVVESVRLIERNEFDNVRRIRKLLTFLADSPIVLHGGVLIEKRGDGLLAKFLTPQSAADCVAQLHAAADAMNADVLPNDSIALRIGLHTAEVLADDSAIYGRGLNIAARVASQAGPGETVISATARDGIVSGLIHEVEDLGDCYLKHLAEPLRLFRLHRAEHASALELPHSAQDDIRACVAVMPFDCIGSTKNLATARDVLIDGLVSELGGCPELRVISRLSTRLLPGHGDHLDESSRLLGANFLVTGRVIESKTGQLSIEVALARARKGSTIWADRFNLTLNALAENGEFIANLSRRIVDALSGSIVAESSYAPLSRIESSALMFGAVHLTHRTSLQDFNRPRLLLEQVIERHSRAAAPRAWLAHWYVMKAVQGQMTDAVRDASIAIAETSRALESQPNHSLALAAQGFAYCHLRRDLDRAERCYRDALAANPSDPYAWLYLGALHAFRSEGEAAELACAQAIRCSPLDPHRHFFYAISATAAFTNHQYEKAVSLAQLARNGDRYHASTVRVLAMSLAMLGRGQDARAVGQELISIEPNLTVERYLSRTPSANYEVGARCARALREAGIPQH